MNPSSLALVLHAALTLLLLVAIAELRTFETLARRRICDSLVVFGEDVSAFSARLHKSLSFVRH
jgi:hypothetical protein